MNGGRNNMNKIILFLGSAFCAALILLTPVLFAVSLIYDWSNFMKFFMGLAASITFLGLTSYIIEHTDENI